ncbi:hypothetical protein DGMP_30930 [Desulfomarina profundi]|uniref:Molybdate-binding protein ModA n=1 Tax=Desulfomarina profundi TaxID=2772557 RepID=A0A8D5FRJ4_9BACT|nr:molybdate ABC transporter substrate-binding protein [Desulfomarina profundi]BCL62400.1 hypothetical protein DGMP_30930 [Desulfomarina profundi]
MKKRILPGIVCLVLLLSSLPLRAQTVRLSVAASLTTVFKNIVAAYEEAHPETECILNLASSGSLAKQIEQGAPVDLFISANQKWMDYLVEEKKINKQTVMNLAGNSLVFLGGKRDNLRKIDDIMQLSRIAIGSPKSVPGGQYAVQAMERSGFYKKIMADHKLVMAKDVRQALMYAERGRLMELLFIELMDFRRRVQKYFLRFP